MNVLTMITIIITGVCLTWSLGLYIFYRIKKSKVEKKAKKDLLEGESSNDKEREEDASKN